MELVDVEELRTLLVAMRPSDVARAAAGLSTQGAGAEGHVRGERYTHCELHVGAALLSPAISTIPMLHMNNAPRNVFGLAQFKQAIGTYSTAFLARMDTLGFVLHHPQRPIVGTSFADRLCGGGDFAQAENIVVAICSYTGYNMEDAILVNKDSVERGRFHLTCYETHRFEEESSTAEGETRAVAFANPAQVEADGGGPVEGLKAASYERIGRDGAPALDSVVEEGDVLLGRIEVTTGMDSAAGGQKRRTVADRSVRATRKTAGTVDRVVLFPSSGGTTSGGKTCKVRMRVHRQPELGDKLASRYSQKGVVGMLLPACDMPFCASSGIVPDIVINPHGFPSRNTVAHLVESLLGKAGACAGARYNVNSLERPQGDPVAEATSVLTRLGLSSAGEEVLYNGRSGEQMDVNVFVGVNYYGRLKHMVADKYQFRERGAVNAITRQPVKTAGGSGGLRIGEMEQNALLANGLAGFLKESFGERSDKYRMTIDADEGTPAYELPGRGGARAGTRAVTRAGAHGAGGPDGAPARFATLEMPYAMKLLGQELNAMSIGVELRVQDVEEDPEGGEAYWDSDGSFGGDPGHSSSGEEDDDDDVRVREADEPNAGRDKGGRGRGSDAEDDGNSDNED